MNNLVRISCALSLFCGSLFCINITVAQTITPCMQVHATMECDGSIQKDPLAIIVSGETTEVEFYIMYGGLGETDTYIIADPIFIQKDKARKVKKDVFLKGFSSLTEDELEEMINAAVRDCSN